MSDIKITRDDAALRINPKAAPDRTVHPVDPAPETPPVGPREAVQPAPQPAARRQRRRGERRRKDMPILLDTRSGEDRRGGTAEDDSDEGGGEERKGPGIDVFV